MTGLKIEFCHVTTLIFTISTFIVRPTLAIFMIQNLQNFAARPKQWAKHLLFDKGGSNIESCYKEG